MSLTDALPKFMQSEINESSNFHALANNEPCIMGIDEAGRGPSIGPMVYACAITPLNQVSKLDKLGINDSKKLKSDKRDSIYKSLECDNTIAFAYSTYSARHISAHMLTFHEPMNLNEIAHASTISLIQNALDSQINIKEVVVDTVGPKEKYQEFLRNKFPNIQVVVEEKADALFKIVGAASIVAKVNRDRLLNSHVFDESGMRKPLSGFGSGYSDAETMQYLSEAFDPVFGYSTLVRFSWKNIDKAVEENAIKCKWIQSNAPQTMLSFFQKVGAKPEIEKTRFFKTKGIKHASKF